MAIPSAESAFAPGVSARRLLAASLRQRPIAGAAAGAERTARAGRGLCRAVAAGDAVEGDDAGPAVQPVGRLARLFRACRACRLPRRLGPAELPADGARLPSARAHALRLPGQRGVHGRRPVRGVLPGRDAAPASAAGRPLRGVREPARPDAGECRRPARAIHLRDVLQSLRLERLQHPGADPVRAAARGTGSQGRRLDRHRRRRRSSGGDVLPQDHLLRRGPGHAGLCRAVPSACRPVLAGVARGRRPAGPQCAGAAQSAIPGRHPGLGDKRRRAQGGDPALQQLRRGDRPVRTVSCRRRGGPVDVVVGTGDVPPAADAPLPAGHVAAAAVAELAGRGHAVGHRRAVRALRPAAHRLLFPRQSRRRAVAADAAAVSAVCGRRLRHEHRGLPCQRPRRTRRARRRAHQSSRACRAGRPARHVPELLAQLRLPVAAGGRAGPAALPAFGLRVRAGAHGRGGHARGPPTRRHRPAGQRQSPALHAGRRARARGESVVDVECAQAASQRVPGGCALRPGPEVRDQPAMDRRHDAPLWRLSGGTLPLGGGDAVLDLADALQSRPADSISQGHI